MQKLTAFVQSHVTAHTTAQLIGTTVVVWLLWEAFVLIFKIPSATISQVTWAYLNRYPPLFGALCFVLGHILWQYRSAWKLKKQADGSSVLVPAEPDDYKTNDKNDTQTNTQTIDTKKGDK